jgi:hypothetical protein
MTEGLNYALKGNILPISELEFLAQNPEIWMGVIALDGKVGRGRKPNDVCWPTKLFLLKINELWPFRGAVVYAFRHKYLAVGAEHRGSPLPPLFRYQEPECGRIV